MMQQMLTCGCIMDLQEKHPWARRSRSETKESFVQRIVCACRGAMADDETEVDILAGSAIWLGWLLRSPYLREGNVQRFQACPVKAGRARTEVTRGVWIDAQSFREASSLLSRAARMTLRVVFSV